jgi:hypothetical protein
MCVNGLLKVIIWRVRTPPARMVWRHVTITGSASSSATRARLSPNLPFRSEACPHIGSEHRFTIMEVATPKFMPGCDVVVNADWCGKRLDPRELLGLQNLCWRPPRT